MAEEQAHSDLGEPAPARLCGWGTGGELGVISGMGCWGGLSQRSGLRTPTF